jgi:SMI1-KNR4 cell-wall
VRQKIEESVGKKWGPKCEHFLTTPPKSASLLTELEQQLQVTFSDDMRWFSLTFGSIYCVPGSEFRILREDATSAVITLHFRETEGLPPGYVVFEYGEDVVGGCWVIDPKTDLVHTWNSYECDGLSQSFGPFLTIVSQSLEKLAAYCLDELGPVE